MKRTIFLAILLSSILILHSPVLAGSKIRVLFVGNSLTFANDLPGMFAKAASSNDHNVEHDMYAPGGYRFSQHASDPNLTQKLKDKK